MFIYYFKKLVRNKGFVFWSFMFPIALMICFHVAFGNLYDIENNFDPIPAVCVVEDDIDIAGIVQNMFSGNGLDFVLENEEMQQFLTIAESGDYEQLNDIYADYSEEEVKEHFSQLEEEIKENIEMMVQNSSAGTGENMGGISGENGANIPENITFSGITMNENGDIEFDLFGNLTEEEKESLKNLFFDMMFQMALEQVASEEAEIQCFDISVTDSLEEARAQLETNEKRVLFILENGDVRIELSKEYQDVDLNVVQSFVSSFKTQYGVMQDQMGDFTNLDKVSLEDLKNRNYEEDDFSEIMGANISSMEIVKAKSNAFNEDPNPYNWYYYATMVMGIMFNILSGIGIVADTQADVSKGAVRINLSAEKKTSILMYSFLARFALSFIITCAQLLIMNLVFDIPIGNRIPQLLMFVIFANLFALSVGEVFGLFLKGKVSERENKANALLMTSVFLSGEMVNYLPGYLQMNCPIVNEINPATVLNFAFYRLVYFESLNGFYWCMLKIAVVTIILLIISVMKMRRQKYASI